MYYTVKYTILCIYIIYCIYLDNGVIPKFKAPLVATVHGELVSPPSTYYTSRRGRNSRMGRTDIPSGGLWWPRA